MNTLVSYTSASDIPELRCEIESEGSQRIFLSLLGVKQLSDLDLAWSNLKVEKETRFREWIAKRAQTIFKYAKEAQDPVFLPDTIYQNIAEYAA